MAPATTTVGNAILHVLCFGKPAYDTGYVGWGTPGLFSQLNQFAEEVLKRAYEGKGPSAGYLPAPGLGCRAVGGDEQGDAAGEPGSSSSSDGQQLAAIAVPAAAAAAAAPAAAGGGGSSKKAGKKRKR